MTDKTVEKKLEFLQHKNRPFTCYTIPIDHPVCDYEIVELEVEGTVLFTLKDYTEACEKDMLCGYTFVPLMIVIFLSITVVHFVLYTKAKKEPPVSQKKKQK